MKRTVQGSELNFEVPEPDLQAATGRQSREYCRHPQAEGDDEEMNTLLRQIPYHRHYFELEDDADELSTVDGGQRTLQLRTDILKRSKEELQIIFVRVGGPFFALSRIGNRQQRTSAVIEGEYQCLHLSRTGSGRTPIEPMTQQSSSSQWKLPSHAEYAFGALA